MHPRKSEQSIFLSAIEIQSLDERAAYLDEVCGDDSSLRTEIDALFEARDRLDELPPESKAGEPAVHKAMVQGFSSDLYPSASIGPYKLLEPIGEGGMGTVWLAEQSIPVRRKVALKVIKPGMDTKQVIARFEAERQALAMMDHPNIARVFDGGMTPDGRPYFVMELVRGTPITEYCDQQQLSIDDRLDLFVLVCRAVQHAHQKGVIHRDLKPSNVLVTIIDGVGVPKVIDFGVAKATGQSLTDKTLFTGFHQFVGTPLYVSPEQAELSGVDVDTRSDIYSLGVLLYELLTGTTPFDSESLKKAAFDEMRRIIREEEPPRPSVRLSTLGDSISSVSFQRKVDPRRLSATMKGELDWVVMKAIEKDRQRRYETATDFAADVERYRTNQVVEACPPSTWYRVRKYADRNRAALTTAGLLSLALVSGTSASTLLAIRAIRSERKAENALEHAETALAEGEISRNEAIQSREETEKARKQAETARELAEKRLAISERHLYAARLHDANEALDARQYERAQEILDEIRPGPDGVDQRDFVWGYLRTDARRDIIVYPRHSSYVRGFIELEGGRKFAFGSEEGEVVIVDTLREKVVRTLSGHSRPVRLLAVSDDGGMLVSAAGPSEPTGGYFGEAFVWDLATGKRLASIDGIEDAWINRIDFDSKSGILAIECALEGLTHHVTKFYDLNSDPARPERLNRDTKSLSICKTSDGRYFTVNSPGVLSAIDILSGARKTIARFEGDRLDWIDLSADRKYLVHFSNVSKDIVVLEAASGKEVDRLHCKDLFIRDGWLSHDGGTIVCRNSSNDVFVWNRSVRTTRTIPVEGKDREKVSFKVTLSPAGEHVAISTWGIPGGQTPLKVHDTSTGNLVATFPGRPEPLSATPFISADGHTMLLSNGLAIKRWKFPGDQPVEPAGHTSEAWSLSFTPDGQFLISGSDDVGEGKTIRVWNLDNGILVTSGKPHVGMLSALAISPDGKRLATGAFSRQTTPKLWSVDDIARFETWKPLKTVDNPTGFDRTVTFSPDGSILAFGGDDKIVLLRNGRTGDELGNLEGHTNKIRWVAFSPDGKWLASASNDHTVRLWDVATRIEKCSYMGPTQFTSLAWSPDATRLAACDKFGMISFLDPATMSETARIHSEDSEIRSLAWSPDGRVLAAAGMGRTIRLWDPLTLQNLLDLKGHEEQVNALAWSPDGSTLASCDHAGKVKLWKSRVRASP
ncbi:protein kinase [bacterium]|nr:protein kinase [bacterium]